ncbi:unnamed protein product [Anisakis simplex]|uniref:PPE family protein n=1 Tax=Anisakis simplex TaxID=6269 RepID=A0A0M3IYM8_ANISI|nr:unnamed protein product [Anisakis simplex]
MSTVLRWPPQLTDSESSTGTRSTVEPLILDDYDERNWFGDSGVPDPGRDPIAQAINLLARPDTMGNLEALIRNSVAADMSDGLTTLAAAAF